MDLVCEFMLTAHTDPFSFTGCLLRMKSQGREISTFLCESQAGMKPVKYKINIIDLARAIKSAESKIDCADGLIVKMVVQKANMTVLPASAASGYWANLVFLCRDRCGDWFVYAYAKGRFKSHCLVLSRERYLGYKIFISISDKSRQISDAFESAPSARAC